MTDNAARDNALRNQAIETALFPLATFEIKNPIDFSNEIDLAAGFTEMVTGVLTIHGVSRRNNNYLCIIQWKYYSHFRRTCPIKLSDYDIEKPRSAVVLSLR